MTLSAEEVEDLQTGPSCGQSSDREITNSNITVVGDIPATITTRQYNTTHYITINTIQDDTILEHKTAELFPLDWTVGWWGTLQSALLLTVN